MKWCDITLGDEGKRVKVWADSTPKQPETGEGPFFGIVYCEGTFTPPVMFDGRNVHNFAAWWDVEFVEERT